MLTFNNLQAPQVSVSRGQREAANGHRATAILLTGLPAAGKSTLAQALHAELFKLGMQSTVLDGDALRSTLNADLGFSETERRENVRRTSELAALLVDSGQIVIMALIAPLADQRALFAQRLGRDYHEIWCSASLGICEQRDPKGHYARARCGQLPGFTGVSAAYEVPRDPALVVDTGRASVNDCSVQLLSWFRTCEIIV